MRMAPAYFCHVSFMKMPISCLLESIVFRKYFTYTPEKQKYQKRRTMIIFAQIYRVKYIFFVIKYRKWLLNLDFHVNNT